MYFTLAISAATRLGCAALAEAAERTDPRVMPIPGPARVTLTALLSGDWLNAREPASQAPLG